jgi:retinol dehydrogenase-12
LLYNKIITLLLFLGVIGTDITRHLEDRFFLVQCCSPISNLFMKTPFYGAQTTLYCCLEDTIESESGLYYSDCAKKTPSRYALDSESAKKLWNISEALVEKK